MCENQIFTSNGNDSVERGEYCAIMHKWFYLRIDDDNGDDDHIEIHSNFEFTRKIHSI